MQEIPVKGNKVSYMDARTQMEQVCIVESVEHSSLGIILVTIIHKKNIHIVLPLAALKLVEA